MSYGAQAYARTSQTTATPREIEAQALLKAARQLREIQTNWTGPDENLHKALMINRRLWCIFFAEAESNESPNSLEVRQGIANIATFVFARTFDMQTEPDPAKLTHLININCNIAAGLAGRPP
jgi:flagellar protein FlaF